MNRGLRLMRKAIYHNRAWTCMRGKPRSGFPLYPIPYSSARRPSLSSRGSTSPSVQPGSRPHICPRTPISRTISENSQWPNDRHWATHPQWRHPIAEHLDSTSWRSTGRSIRQPSQGMAAHARSELGLGPRRSSSRFLRFLVSGRRRMASRRMMRCRVVGFWVPWSSVSLTIQALVSCRVEPI